MAVCHKSILCAFSKQKGWCISCLFSIIPLFPFLEWGVNPQRGFSCRRPPLPPHLCESIPEAAVTRVAIKTRGETPQGFTWVTATFCRLPQDLESLQNLKASPWEVTSSCEKQMRPVKKIAQDWILQSLPYRHFLLYVGGKANSWQKQFFLYQEM